MSSNITTSTTTRPFSMSGHASAIAANGSVLVQQSKSAVFARLNDRPLSLLSFSSLGLVETDNYAVAARFYQDALWLAVAAFDSQNGDFHTYAFQFDNMFMLKNRYTHTVSDVKFTASQISNFRPYVKWSAINSQPACISFLPPVDANTNWTQHTISSIPPGRVLLWRPALTPASALMVSVLPSQGYLFGATNVTIQQRYVVISDSFVSDASLSMESANQRASARLHVYAFDADFQHEPTEIGIIAKTNTILSGQDIGFIDDGVLAVREDEASTSRCNVLCYKISGYTLPTFQSVNSSSFSLNGSVATVTTATNTTLLSMRSYDTQVRWHITNSYLALLCWLPQSTPSGQTAVVLYKYGSNQLTSQGTWYVKGYPTGLALHSDSTQSVVRVDTIDLSKAQIGTSRTLKVVVPIV